MRTVSPATIVTEHATLDAIHRVLDRTRGLTAREIADRTGLAIGRISPVLRKSEAVIKRLAGTHLWISDYTDLEGYSMPVKPPRRPYSRPRQNGLALRP